ncbi:MAG: hypothetical protein HY744_01840 [Deltaproteobacteria bacterium]|nr:hypothetical protein [Deltaproteobacteria bacterium]
MADLQRDRTVHSQRGYDFGMRFAAWFSNVMVSDHIPRLAEPAGDTTGGGTQATQHLTLEPFDEAQPVVALGWVNCASGLAKLRTFECLAELHWRRFGRQPFAVDGDPYRAFFEKLVSFLKEEGMKIDVETDPPEVAAVASRREGAPGRAKHAWIIAAVSVAVLAALAVVAFLVLRR